MTSHFSGQVRADGVPLNGGGIPATYGRYVFVDADFGSDSNSGFSMDNAKLTIDGSAGGDSVMRTNRHDVMVINANSSFALTAEWTITKNRCHYIGLGLANRHYGQRTKINLGVSTGTGVAAIQNTGVGNTFQGLKVTNSDTLSTSLYSVAEGGEFTLWAYCEFLKTTDLDQTTAAELLHNGDSVRFEHCAIGNGIYTPSVARQNILFTRETITGKVCRDLYMYDCLLMSRCGSTTFVNCRATTNDIERLGLMEKCKFIAVKTSTAVQDEAFGIASALTDARVHLDDCIVDNITNIATAASGIFTNQPAGADLGGLMIECT